MPVVASDIKFYGAANHAENDSSTQGGAIDLTKKIELAIPAANDLIDVVSSSGSDTTQTVTITGRLASGAIDTEVYSLNGTTPDTGAKTFNRILKVVMSATAVGTVTVRRNGGGAPTLCTLEPGITSVRTLFYGLQASASASKTAEEKFFIKNTHGTLSYTGVTVTLIAEPANINDMLIALEDAVNDNNSIANRLATPSGNGSYVQLSTATSVPGDGNLDAGEAIGCWVRMIIDTNETPTLDDIQIRTSGGTT